MASGLINGLLGEPRSRRAYRGDDWHECALYGLVLKISGGTPVAVPASLAAFANGKMFGLSNLVYLAAFRRGGCLIVVRRRRFGRTFEAGAPARAARAAASSPIATRSGLCRPRVASIAWAASCCAGLMTLPSPFQGDTYLMPSIASVVIGGTSLFRRRLISATPSRRCFSTIAAARADHGIKHRRPIPVSRRPSSWSGSASTASIGGRSQPSSRFHRENSRFLRVHPDPASHSGGKILPNNRKTSIKEEKTT